MGECERFLTTKTLVGSSWKRFFTVLTRVILEHINKSVILVNNDSSNGLLSPQRYLNEKPFSRQFINIWWKVRDINPIYRFVNHRLQWLSVFRGIRMLMVVPGRFMTCYIHFINPFFNGVDETDYLKQKYNRETKNRIVGSDLCTRLSLVNSVILRKSFIWKKSALCNGCHWGNRCNHRQHGRGRWWAHFNISVSFYAPDI